MAFAVVTPGWPPPCEPQRRVAVAVRGTAAPTAIITRGGGHGGSDGGSDGGSNSGGGRGGGTLATLSPTRRRALGMAAAAVTAAATATVVTGALSPSIAAEDPPAPPRSRDGGRPTGLGDRLRAARQEAFADAMDTGMGAYETAVAGRKGALLREAFRVAAATREGTSVADAMTARGGAAGGVGGGDGGGGSSDGGSGSSDGGSGGEIPAMRILDVGIGTAPNVGYYPRGAAVTGVDPSAAMTARALTNTRRRRPDVRLVTVPSVAAAAAAAASAGALYDVAVCTLTLCSVDDPAGVVAAVAATLRPGGVFVFVEHVGARPADGGSSVPAVAAAVGLRVLQTLANPAQMVLADGCHLTRDAEVAVRAAAPWAAVTAERFRVSEGGALLISPHVAGLAVKAI